MIGGRIRGVLFGCVFLLLAPVTLLGLLWYAGRVVWVSRRAGTSATAYEPLLLRVILDRWGARPDPAAVRLLGALPATNPLMFWMLVGPTFFAARLSRWTPSLLVYPPSLPAPMRSLVHHRTVFFDRAMASHAAAVGQVLILGAGWDTRAFGPLCQVGTKVFEVDTAAMQVVKRAALRRADLDAARVTFVAVDFEQESWLTQVVAAGLDPAVATFVLWEGVSYYLAPAAVAATLTGFATFTGPRSRLAWDYPARALVDAEVPFVRVGGWIQRLLRIVDEPWLFGIEGTPTRAGISTWVARYGLRLAEFEPLGTAIPYGGLVEVAVETSPGRRA